MVQSLVEKGLRKRDTFQNYIPMRKFIMPSDIAYTAVFLCSNKAQFITGVTLPVDAGVLSAGVWRAYGLE
jgi:3-oxoacyl-[acyl-carrier protein] reductase